MKVNIIHLITVALKVLEDKTKIRISLKKYTSMLSKLLSLEKSLQYILDHLTSEEQFSYCKSITTIGNW